MLLIAGLPNDPCIAAYTNANGVVKEFVTSFNSPRGHFKTVMWLLGSADVIKYYL